MQTKFLYTLNAASFSLSLFKKKEKGGREGGEGGEVGKEKKKGERERSLRDTNSQSSEPEPARGSSASKQRFEAG